MRTSNKLILGILIGPLLILTLLNLALYAKYKAGNYVSFKSVQEDRFIRMSLPNISHIAVYGLENVRIVSSDSLKLEIEKDSRGHLHYAIKGDSLIIHGDSVITRYNGTTDVERSYQDVNLYLPIAPATILADNSGITVKGTKDSVKAASYYFSVVNNATVKVDQDGDDTTHVYFKGLTIHASHAAGIELTAATRINDLQLTMIESPFADNGASIDKLTIEADKKSSVFLKGDNLQKVNVVKQP